MGVLEEATCTKLWSLVVGVDAILDISVVVRDRTLMMDLLTLSNVLSCVDNDEKTGNDVSSRRRSHTVTSLFGHRRL